MKEILTDHEAFSRFKRPNAWCVKIITQDDVKSRRHDLFLLFIERLHIDEQVIFNVIEPNFPVLSIEKANVSKSYFYEFVFMRFRFLYFTLFHPDFYLGKIPNFADIFDIVSVYSQFKFI